MSFEHTSFVSGNVTYDGYAISVLKLKALTMPFKNKITKKDEIYKDIKYFFRKIPLGANFTIYNREKGCCGQSSEVCLLKTYSKFCATNFPLIELFDIIGLVDNCKIFLSEDHYCLYKRLFLKKVINNINIEEVNNNEEINLPEAGHLISLNEHDAAPPPNYSMQ